MSAEVPAATRHGVAEVFSVCSSFLRSVDGIFDLIPFSFCLIFRDAVPSCSTEEFVKEASAIQNFLEEVEKCRTACPEGSGGSRRAESDQVG